jgi:tRNA modification GTPase
LKAEIVRRIDLRLPELGGEVVAINARHAHALTRANQALAAAIEGLKNGLSGELVVSELRAALDAYGDITGRIDNERMLDQLFATFCIGK